MKAALVNGLTLLNALCGLGAVGVLLLGSGPDRAWWAALLLAGAMIPDILDGLAARALGVSSKVGALLDINADTVTFNVSTAILVLAVPGVLVDELWTRAPGLGIAGAIAAGGYLGAGLWRSSRMAVLGDPPTEARHFWGMTTNLASLCVGAAVLLGPTLPLDQVLQAALVVVVALLVAPLMVSRILYADVPAHLMQRRLSPWPPVLLAISALLLPPAWPWAVWILGNAVVPLALHALGRRPR